MKSNNFNNPLNRFNEFKKTVETIKNNNNAKEEIISSSYETGTKLETFTKEAKKTIETDADEDKNKIRNNDSKILNDLSYELEKMNNEYMKSLENPQLEMINYNILLDCELEELYENNKRRSSIDNIQGISLKKTEEIYLYNSQETAADEFKEDSKKYGKFSPSLEQSGSDENILLQLKKINKEKKKYKQKYKQTKKENTKNKTTLKTQDLNQKNLEMTIESLRKQIAENAKTLKKNAINKKKYDEIKTNSEYSEKLLKTKDDELKALKDEIVNQENKFQKTISDYTLENSNKIQQLILEKKELESQIDDLNKNLNGDEGSRNMSPKTIEDLLDENKKCKKEIEELTVETQILNKQLNGIIETKGDENKKGREIASQIRTISFLQQTLDHYRQKYEINVNVNSKDNADTISQTNYNSMNSEDKFTAVFNHANSLQKEVEILKKELKINDEEKKKLYARLAQKNEIFEKEDVELEEEKDVINTYGLKTNKTLFLEDNSFDLDNIFNSCNDEPIIVDDIQTKMNENIDRKNEEEIERLTLLLREKENKIFDQDLDIKAFNDEMKDTIDMLIELFNELNLYVEDNKRLEEENEELFNQKECFRNLYANMKIDFNDMECVATEYKYTLMNFKKTHQAKLDKLKKERDEAISKLSELEKSSMKDKIYEILKYDNISYEEEYDVSELLKKIRKLERANKNLFIENDALRRNLDYHIINYEETLQEKIYEYDNFKNFFKTIVDKLYRVSKEADEIIYARITKTMKFAQESSDECINDFGHALGICSTYIKDIMEVKLCIDSM